MFGRKLEAGILRERHRMSVFEVDLKPGYFTDKRRRQGSLPVAKRAFHGKRKMGPEVHAVQSQCLARIRRVNNDSDVFKSKIWGPDLRAFKVQDKRSSRAFAITSALQLMTTFVAFVGVLSAMMSLQLDKQRQLGILKAIGLSSRQLWRLIILETGLMGAVAGLLSMPTGYVLALILVFIINRRSFGWTLQMQVTLEPFVQAFAIAFLAAILAGLYPALRITKRNTAEAIRFD